MGDIGFVYCKDMMLRHFLLGEEELLEMLRKQTSEVRRDRDTKASQSKDTPLKGSRAQP